MLATPSLLRFDARRSRQCPILRRHPSISLRLLQARKPLGRLQRGRATLSSAYQRQGGLQAYVTSGNYVPQMAIAEAQAKAARSSPAFFGPTCLFIGPRVVFCDPDCNTTPVRRHAIFTFAYGMLQPGPGRTILMDSSHFLQLEAGSKQFGAREREAPASTDSRAENPRGTQPNPRPATSLIVPGEPSTGLLSIDAIPERTKNAFLIASCRFGCIVLPHESDARRQSERS
jgi:hypothetical protein